MKVRTLATTVRCDARDAAMALYLCDSNDIRIVSVSDLFRECIAIVAEIAVVKGLVPRITETQQAVDYLQKRQIIDLLDKSRPNLTSLVKTLAVEDGRPIKSVPTSAELRQAISDRLGRDKADIEKLKSFIPNGVDEEEL